MDIGYIGMVACPTDGRRPEEADPAVKEHAHHGVTDKNGEPGPKGHPQKLPFT